MTTELEFTDRYAHMISCLNEGLYTSYEIAEITGLHFRTVAKYTNSLHKIGMVHIAMWDGDVFDRDAKRVFKLGPGKDAPRKPIDPNAASRRWKAKQRHLKLLRRFAG